MNNAKRVNYLKELVACRAALSGIYAIVGQVHGREAEELDGDDPRVLSTREVTESSLEEIFALCELAGCGNELTIEDRIEYAEKCWGEAMTAERDTYRAACGLAWNWLHPPWRAEGFEVFDSDGNNTLSMAGEKRTQCVLDKVNAAYELWIRTGGEKR